MSEFDNKRDELKNELCKCGDDSNKLHVQEKEEEEEEEEETEEIENKQLIIPLVQYYTDVRPNPVAIVLPYSEVTLNIDFEEK